MWLQGWYECDKARSQPLLIDLINHGLNQVLSGLFAFVQLILGLPLQHQRRLSVCCFQICLGYCRVAHLSAAPPAHERVSAFVEKAVSSALTVHAAVANFVAVQRVGVAGAVLVADGGFVNVEVGCGIVAAALCCIVLRHSCCVVPHD